MGVTTAAPEVPPQAAPAPSPGMPPPAKPVSPAETEEVARIALEEGRRRRVTAAQAAIRAALTEQRCELVPVVVVAIGEDGITRYAAELRLEARP
jgi:hypothetical protein